MVWCFKFVVENCLKDLKTDGSQTITADEEKGEKGGGGGVVVAKHVYQMS